MTYILEFWHALIDLSLAMSPYILFGLFFAGLLHEIVPDSIVTRHLGRDNILSVIKSTIFGIPLPVCSCGVIPLATSIKKSGASKGATLSFLISTPITGVDSILATYGIFGWIFTLYRIVTSIVIAIISGVLTNLFDSSKTSADDMGPNDTMEEKKESSCCSSGSCCGDDKKNGFSLISSLKYGFVTLLGDIAKPLFWGLLIGTLITVLIPDDLSKILVDNSWLSYLIVIAIAVPMYVCATASLPIAAALMLSGVSAGAAFVFLTAGPATNTVTIGVVKKMLGNRSLYIYLGSIILGSLIFGLGLDAIFHTSDIDPRSLVHTGEQIGFVSIVSSIVLWSFLFWFMVRSKLIKNISSEDDCCCKN